MGFGLELGGGPVGEGGVFAVIVIVGIDAVENLGARVGFVEEAAALEHFAFEGTHEGLGPGILVGIGPG